MKNEICRILQVLLLFLYAIGVFVIILGAFGIAIDLFSYFAQTAMPNYKINLAQIGLGAILTYVAKKSEQLLVALIKPSNDKFLALLDRPLASFFKKTNN